MKRSVFVIVYICLSNLVFGLFGETVSLCNARSVNSITIIENEISSTTLTRIDAKNPTEIFLDSMSISSDFALKRYQKAILDPLTYGQSAYEDSLVSRTIVFSAGGAVALVAVLDKGMAPKVNEAFKRVEEFYIENFLTPYAVSSHDRNTGTPIDSILAILAVPTPNGYYYLTRHYRSVGYGAGEEIRGYVQMDNQWYELGSIDDNTLSSLAQVDIKALFAKQQAQEDKVRLDAFIYAYNRELNWYANYWLPRYATTRAFLSGLASPEELKTMDGEAFSLFLNHWFAAIREVNPTGDLSTRDLVVARLKSDMMAKIPNTYGVDIDDIPFDDSCVNIKYAAFMFLGGLGDYCSGTGSLKGLSKNDIDLLVTYVSSDADREFLYREGTTVLRSMSTENLARLIEIVLSVDLSAIYKDDTKTYTDLFYFLWPLINARRQLVKNELRNGATTDYPYQIPPMNDEEKKSFLELVLYFFPARYGKIMESFPEHMVDANEMPFGSSYVW